MTQNTYVPDSKWDKMRDSLAATILVRRANELHVGNAELDDSIPTAALDQLTDIVRGLASEQMADIGIMPESCREDAA